MESQHIATGTPVMPTHEQATHIEKEEHHDEKHHHGTISGAVLGGLAGKHAGHGVTGAVLGGMLGHHHDNKQNH